MEIKLEHLDYQLKGLQQLKSLEGEGNRFSMLVADEVLMDRGWGYIKLKVRKENINAQRLKSSNVPLLDSHNMDKPIGKVESISAENGQLKATAVFSKNPKPQAILADIKDGIRVGVSPGLNITKYSEDKHKDGRPIITAEEWELIEISSVATPQSPKARMTEALQFGIKTNSEVEFNMENEEKVSDNRVEEILEVGKENNDAEGALEAALAGKTKEEYMLSLLEKRKVYAEPAPAPEAPKVVETSEFSLASVIRHLADPYDSHKREAAEASLDISSKLVDNGSLREGMEGVGSSVPVPWSAFTQTTATAEELVRKQIGSNVGPLIEASPFLSRARVYPNLTGDFQVPVFSKGSAVYAGTAEGVAPAPADFSLAGPKLTPHTTIVRTQVSELALLQSDGQLESGMRDMFMREATDAINAAIVDGSGNNPTGFLRTSGVSSTAVDNTLSNAVYAHLTALIRNTQEAGKIANDTTVAGGMFVMSPLMMEHYKSQLKIASTLERVLERNGARYTVDGYDVFPSNHMPSDAGTAGNKDGRMFCAFLDASELHVGFWGSVRLSVNPYGNPLAPTFTFYVYWDVGIAHPGSVSLVNFNNT